MKTKPVLFRSVRSYFIMNYLSSDISLDLLASKHVTFMNLKTNVLLSTL